MARRSVSLLIALLCLAAAIAAAGGLLPFEWLQPAGARIRRPDDVTPERYARYLHVCWFFALMGALAAGWLYLRRDEAADFLRTSRRELRPPCGDWTRGERLVCALIAIVAAILRLQWLAAPVAYDEAYTWINFASRPWYIAIADYNSTNNHLLNTFLVHWCGRLFGPEEWALRLPVFVLGSLLPICAFAWGRRWMGAAAALLAAALVAVSPALITYSVDARGYMFVAVAAVLFDHALASLRSGGPAGPRWMAAAALTAGSCAMPLMLYPALGSLAWRLLLGAAPAAAPDGDVQPPRRGSFATVTEIWRTIQALAPILFVSMLCILLFYTPAYVFRGLLFLQDPIMQAAGSVDFAKSLAAAWWAAWKWWTDGVLPGWLWGILLLGGAWSLGFDLHRWGRWLAPLAVALALNLLQWVAPPPRIYLHLSPWIFLMAAAGLLIGIPRRWKSRAAGLAVAGILVAGSWEAMRRPVLFYSEDRAGYISVPDVIERVHREIARRPQEHHTLIAPLPCDLPSIFYMDRRGFRIPLNELPPAGGRVWLMARPEEAPVDVLHSPLVDLGKHATSFTRWRTIGRWQALWLYEAVYTRDRGLVERSATQ